MHSVGTGWMWIGFLVFVLFVIAIDMFLLGNKKTQIISLREALKWTFIWVSCALLFDVVLWWHLLDKVGELLARQRALEFLSGYIIELSLSVDNLFVFIMIFTHFSVPECYQQRVLLYGVLGAIIMRFIMIVGGSWLVAEFHWILYLFGLFLVYTGIKMIFAKEAEKDLSKNRLLVFIRRHMRVTQEYEGNKFFVKKQLFWYVTPLFIVLLMIEFSDLVFALDSIPAIFSVTSDPFIIFTSNIFAIMGLRSLYFVLSYMASQFYLLKYGIAIVLTFVGAKMLVAPWLKVPVVVTLSLVISILATSVILSLLARSKE